MVPVESLITLVLDRNKELKQRIEELKVLYASRHELLLKRLNLSEDPIMGINSISYLENGYDNINQYIDDIASYLEDIRKSSVIDDEFNDALLYIADQYSILLNEYMDLKSDMMHSYTEAYVQLDDYDINKIIAVRDRVMAYIRSIITYNGIVALALRNELRAYKLSRSSDLL